MTEQEVLENEIEETNDQEQEVDSDELLNRRAALKKTLADLKEKRDFFKSESGAEIIDQLRNQIDYIRGDAMNENIDPQTNAKQIHINVGKVQTCDDIRAMLDGLAWDNDIEQAQEELELFEADNALFLEELDAETSGKVQTV